MTLSQCVDCDSKKLRLINNKKKTQKTGGFLSSSGINTPLSQVPLVGPLLF